jgi:hypothetical protein
VSGPGTVVYVVGSKHRSKEFLHLIGIFIDAAGAADAGDGVRTVLLDDVFEFLSDEIQRFIPRGFAKIVLLADQRLLESFLGINKIVSESSLDAQTSVVGGSVFRGRYLDYPRVNLFSIESRAI